MKNHKTIYSEVIKDILHIADQLHSTDQSWRGEYLKGLAADAEKALSIEKKELAERIIQNCQKAIDRWNIEISQKEDENNTQQASIIAKSIDSKLENYLKIEKEYCLKKKNKYKEFSDLLCTEPEEAEQVANVSTVIWNKYRRWSEMETAVWDKVCIENLSRIKFAQDLDFSKYLSETWGPYNTKYNVIKALDRLKKSDPEWLESYLMLYDSLQQMI